MVHSKAALTHAAMIPALDINSSNCEINLNMVVYGNGPKIMFAFHGIGQDHRCFSPLVQLLKDEYTFYLFDLPFHGQSPPLATEKLPMDGFRIFLDVVLEQNHIQKFSVMGFSMGGRFALAALNLFPEHIQSCWLLAPDGITESPWYRFATRSKAGKNLFQFFVNNSPYFKKLSAMLIKIGLVNKSAVKFAETTLSTPDQRARVYCSWIGFSLIRVDTKHIAQLIKKNNIDLKVFLGKYDTLLPAHYVEPLIKPLYVKAKVLNTGHHRLIEKVAEWMKETLV